MNSLSRMEKMKLHSLCTLCIIGTKLVMNVACQLMRVNYLWAFYCHLVKDVSFDRFPAPGMYIKGIPIVTYCGILQRTAIHVYVCTTFHQSAAIMPAAFCCLCVNFFFQHCKFKGSTQIGMSKSS